MKLPNLVKVRESKGYTQIKLSEMSGVTRGAIGNYESGGGAKKDNALAIAKALQVNVSELIDSVDNDSALSEDAVEYRAMNGPEKIHLLLSELPDKDSDQYIPYYNVEITAGRIEQFFEDADEIPDGYIYAPQYHDCIACHVKGDSMYDRIFPGSRLYVYYMKNKKYIDYGQIYLIVLDGYRLLKYIHPHPTDETKVLLSSYNKHYSDWPVERDDILHLFLVKGYENQNAN